MTDKILIHACPKREQYVKKTLMPEITRQIREVNADIGLFLYIDKDGIGNQKAFLDSVRILDQRQESFYDNTWHLQDDVWPSADFIQTIITYSLVTGIICGFGTRAACRGKSPGWTTACGMYTSFQCIRIPDMMIHGMRDYVFRRYTSEINTNKWDDALFSEYLEKYAPYYPVLNLAPSIVEHVDYIIGGSVLNSWRKYRPTAIEFDQSAVEDLKKRLKEGNHG